MKTKGVVVMNSPAGSLGRRIAVRSVEDESLTDDQRFAPKGSNVEVVFEMTAPLNSAVGSLQEGQIVEVSLKVLKEAVEGSLADTVQGMLRNAPRVNLETVDATGNLVMVPAGVPETAPTT